MVERVAKVISEGNHTEEDILLMLYDLGKAMNDLADYYISRWGTREDIEDRDITFQ
jgi:hypothetical protein